MVLWTRRLCLIVFASLTMAFTGFAEDSTQPSLPVDPLTASLQIGDAQRFARLFTATNGKPTAEQIQQDYLDGASYGVTVFTEYRIESARHLAETIAAHHDDYAVAIRDCLPHLEEYNSDLRSIFLAIHGLLPDNSLPQIYVVFGAGNSGGTAGPGIQVLGLEVLCKASGGTASGLRNTLRRFFAHETVHTFQADPTEAGKDPLLAQALTEGGADFIASIVTGAVPEPERARWASQREAFLWEQFQKDLLATRPSSEKANPSAARQATLRWIGNYQNAPSGWPFEVGYWEGMRIWQCYYQSVDDKHKAIRDVLSWNDPEAILNRSHYHGTACGLPMGRVHAATARAHHQFLPVASSPSLCRHSHLPDRTGRAPALQMEGHQRALCGFNELLPGLNARAEACFF